MCPRDDSKLKHYCYQSIVALPWLRVASHGPACNQSDRDRQGSCVACLFFSMASGVTGFFYGHAGATPDKGPAGTLTREFT